MRRDAVWRAAFKAGAPGERLAAGLYSPFAILWVVGSGACIGFAVFMSVILPTLDIDPSIPSWTMVLSICSRTRPAWSSISPPCPIRPLLRRKAEIVGIDAARFRIAATAPGLFGLQVVNGLIVVFTLGSGSPSQPPAPSLRLQSADFDRAHPVRRDPAIRLHRAAQRRTGGRVRHRRLLRRADE
ncbi:MAG: hypothetical protein R3C52_00940 [Hyphomonadaceae bacterium]